MRLLILVVLFGGISGFGLSARADDFGPRFQEEAPVALADNSYGVADIEPSAGDQESTVGGEYSASDNQGEGQDQYADYVPLPPVIEQ
ncbi:MAG: hypothetical protein DHS20C02_15160 [Micavibrio sp.]|nr:MAG: hypothetical protein DHS20C02_15160 [Micavibrio sp.]